MFWGVFGFLLRVLEVLGGFLRGFGGFGVAFEGFWRFLGGFQGEHHHRCDYFSKPSGPINLRCFLR